MGQRIAKFDWSVTPLGRLEDWNDGLKTSLSLMLNSQQPMWIGWGDQATFFYNDAYIDVLSHAKHPGALGLPARVVWSEIWDFCGPLAEKVFKHGEATFVSDVQLFMDRGDFLEETYYSFSYSPITDTQGKVSGLFCPSTETSSKNLNARRLATLSDLSANALSERTAQAACASAAVTLAQNPADIPFAAIYLYRAEDNTLVLEQTVRIAPGGNTTPALVPLDGPDDGSFAATIRNAARRGSPWVVPGAGLLDTPVGLAGQKLRDVILLPIASPDPNKPVGLLVAGVNPARLLDTDHRTFFDLLANQIDASISNARMSEEQHERVEQLAELDRAKTAFFSNVSHEFRTPLTLLLGPLNDAMQSAVVAGDAQLKEQLGLMQRNATRLQKLVNTLLDFSRTQAGRMEVAFAPIDLASFTIDLASGFRSLIESVGMSLEVDCPPLSQAVYVDALMWEKIVLNLLSNAFKFTFEGSIAVRLHEIDGMVRLDVSDTGSGIPKEALPRLFERFHRVEGARSRTHEGSGIGLALVRDLVSLHGGSIQADSEVGVGTCFTVLIPSGRDHLRDQKITPSSQAMRRQLADSYTTEAAGWISRSTTDSETSLGQQHTPPSENGLVLVVDDNPDMRSYIKRLLEELWTVEVAGNGIEALAAVSRRIPDVIVSDVMMPELDGFGLISRLRAHALTRTVPVILLSARAGDEARVEGLRAGANDYLVKPFSSQELTARVASQMQKAKTLALETQTYRRMAAIFEQMPVGIAILRGRDLIFELANPAYLDLINQREVIGMPIHEALPELEGQGIFERLRQVFDSGETYSANALRSDVRMTPDGPLEEHYFDLVWQPLFDASGQVEAIAVVATDVTVNAKASQSAELASRTKDDFLAMLGHELRNPLAPISIALEIMRMRDDNVMARERAIIERQTQHMIRLVDDLLDVSRIASGKITLKVEPVEISTIAARALELCSPLMEERRHHFRGDVPNSGLMVSADLSRMAQVLANLLTNAAKYTDPQGTITLRAYEEGGDVLIVVEDSGIGIKAESLPLIFEKFVQERQSIDRARGGVGLGLAIAKSITELHGGSIRADSQGFGQGSRFTVRLPLLKLSEYTPPDHLDLAGTAALPSAERGRRVLVVDDNADIVNMFEAVLQMDGFDVRVALDPTAAIKVAQEFKPAIALLDIGLPGMDGYELVGELRRMPELAETRFIAITGYGQNSDRERSKEAGFASHLVKPVEIDQLRRALQSDPHAA
jgi:signal transduction histidine kinase